LNLVEKNHGEPIQKVIKTELNLTKKLEIN
jgi:hypothetical protein